MRTTLSIIWRSIVDWWYAMIPLMIICTAWILLALPVVTFPAATAGIFGAARIMVKGQTPGLGEWWETFKRYFLQSLVWGAANVIAFFAIVTAIPFYLEMGGFFGYLLNGLSIIAGVVWIGAQLYFWPFLIIQEEETEVKSIRRAWRNGLFFTLATPIMSLFFVVISVLLIGASLFLLAPIFLGIPGLVAILANRAVRVRLQGFQEQVTEQDADESED